MAAFLAHGSATPTTLTLGILDMELSDDVPGPMHKTAGRGVLSYVIGVFVRSAKVTLLLNGVTERDQFRSFYRTAKAANTRFSLTPDSTNYPADVWSTFFMSPPQYKPKLIPGARICWEVSFDIEDAPVNV
jgi:hypothetical protein